MPGIVQVIIITKQHFGTMPTFCIRCKKRISFKIIRDDGSYTQLCRCGCTLYQYHPPDEFHKTAFFTKKFIPAKQFDKKYKDKDGLEKEGFTKKEKNGNKVYIK